MSQTPFHVTATFDVSGVVSTIVEMSRPLDSAEFFARIKSGYLLWRDTLPPGKHSLSIYTTVPRRDESYRKLVEAVCANWNRDPAISKLVPVRVELSLCNRGDSWIGCTTAVDDLDETGQQREMHFLDYATLLKDIERWRQLSEEEERVRRRANPVRNPVALPRRIASEIAQYLRLEYGESSRDPKSVKVRDLVFEGEFDVDGVPTQFWRYPTSDPKKLAWATVERFDDSYCLGMTNRPPKEKSRLQHEG